MFTFTPLLGARSHSEATQSILEFDGGVKLLIDAGWDATFDTELLREIEKQAPTLSLVLLTHPTLSHLGAFVHLCKYVPQFRQIPVYATTPVISLGRTLLQDVYSSTALASTPVPLSSIKPTSSESLSDTGSESQIFLPPPSNEEIAECFASIHPLKYSQPHQPVPSSNSPPLEGLTITAYRAGHTLGGTIWHIQHGLESVVHAVDWNHTRENVLSGAAWLGNPGSTGAEVVEPLRRPTALICSSRGADVLAQSTPWARRDITLVNHIKAVVKSGGTVLIPADSSARLLELSYVLEKACRTDASIFAPAKMYLASKSCGATMRFASSMLEWMDESIVREFEAAASAQGKAQAGPQSSQPFDFRYLKLLERKSQVEKALSASGPKVFLASDSSLEWGLAREILSRVAGDGKNLIILPANPDFLCTMQDVKSTSVQLGLAKILKEQRGSHTSDETQTSLCDNITLQLRDPSVTFLAGDDLSVYQQYLTEQRQRQAALFMDKPSDLETTADVVDQDDASSSSSDDEESDTEQQGRALNMSTTMNTHKHKLGITDEELGVNILLRRKNVHDYDVRGKRGRERIFPYISKRRRNDEFGDLVRPEDYLRAEERGQQDADGDASDSKRLDDINIGQKRKWDAGASGSVPSRHSRNQSDVAMPSTTRNARKGAANVPNGDHDGAEDDANDSEESDYEPAEATISGPTRVTLKQSELSLACSLAAVDYNGFHDRRSLQMLIPLIRPQKLILTAGTEGATLALAADCRHLLSEAAQKDEDGEKMDIIFHPQIGETIDASVETNAWTIKLSQNLYRQLQWQKFRGLGLVTVNGQVELALDQQGGDAEGADEAAAERAGKLLKSASGSDTSAAKSSAGGRDTDGDPSSNLPVLNPLNTLATSTASAPTAAALQSIHVGDLRLAELRKLLSASGQHTAEFKGEGTLLVDGCVAVRKSGVGRIEVETAGVRRSFAKVKRRIYDGLAIVAAR